VTTDLDLTKYKALSFDCYGTLIDWETGIAAVLCGAARLNGTAMLADSLLAGGDPRSDTALIRGARHRWVTDARRRSPWDAQVAGGLGRRQPLCRPTAVDACPRWF
jgi:hypothetical protein